MELPFGIVPKDVKIDLGAEVLVGQNHMIFEFKHEALRQTSRVTKKLVSSNVLRQPRAVAGSVEILRCLFVCIRIVELGVTDRRDFNHHPVGAVGIQSCLEFLIVIDRVSRVAVDFNHKAIANFIPNSDVIDG
jgi:hypothetical protein